MDLADKSAHQGTLFSSGVSQMASPQLMDTFDSINKRFGRDTPKLASGVGSHRWAARFAMKSNSFTNDWNALPQAR